jgi:hypothetical protein
MITDLLAEVPLNVIDKAACTGEAGMAARAGKILLDRMALSV